MVLDKGLKINGFKLIKGFLNNNCVNELRDNFQKFFKNKTTLDTQNQVIRTSDFVKNQLLCESIFNEKLKKVYEKVFSSEIGIIKYLLVQRNHHTQQWHTDAQTQGRVNYIYNPSYHVYKCAVYLQNDTKEWGGATEFKVRSHKVLFNDYIINNNQEYLTKLGKLMRLLPKYIYPNSRLKVESGDLVLFHANLWHKATKPKSGNFYKKTSHLQNVVENNQKYMISWEIAPISDYLNVYLHHMYNRSTYNQFFHKDAFETNDENAFANTIQKYDLKYFNINKKFDHKTIELSNGDKVAFDESAMMRKEK